MATTPPRESEAQNEYKVPRPSKFRFKSSRRHRHGDDRDDRDRRSDDGHNKKRRRHDDDDKSRSDSRHRHRHHHRKRRRDSQSEYEPNRASLNDPESGETLNPEQAFRESLFDALADDEGAAFWEGVYGQPIHVYPNAKPGPTGELEQMSDEEYAAYVRARMYEKSHEYIEQERQRRQEERRRHRAAEKESDKYEEEARRRAEEHRAFQDKVQESLRRGEERKNRKRLQEAWETYNVRWDKLRSSTSQESTQNLRQLIPWPVPSGRMKDVSKEEVERFFKSAPSGTDLQQLLKGERVKWHPDKMQQKFGGQEGVETETLQAITAVFQIIDAMWNDLRTAAKK